MPTSSNYEEVDDLVEELKWMTGGPRSRNACIDAVGMEAHGHPGSQPPTTIPNKQ